MSFIYSIFSFLFPLRRLVRIAVLGAVLVFGLTAPTLALASKRTGWFSDVPLIDGVVVDAQLSFAFDSPSGRILALFLQTKVADKELFSSYRGTLKALGWMEYDGRFVKGEELLSLEKIEVEGKTVWRLTIIPMSAKQLEIR